MIAAIEHVQLAMPAGQEAQARAFYSGVLGLAEVEKPEALKHRGGVWFRVGEQQLHLGVEEPFQAARKAHPAFRVAGVQAVAQTLTVHGYSVSWDALLPGVQRFYIHDPFGNRLEFLEPDL